MPNFLRKPNPVRVKNDDDLGGIIDAVRALKSSIAWRRRFSPKGWTKAEINIQYVYTGLSQRQAKGQRLLCCGRCEGRAQSPTVMSATGVRGAKDDSRSQEEDPVSGLLTTLRDSIFDPFAPNPASTPLSAA